MSVWPRSLQGRVPGERHRVLAAPSGPGSRSFACNREVERKREALRAGKPAGVSAYGTPEGQRGADAGPQDYCAGYRKQEQHPLVLSLWCVGRRVATACWDLDREAGDQGRFSSRFRCCSCRE